MADPLNYKCDCPTGKSCFLSYDRAQTAIKHFRAKRSAIKIDGSFLEVYRCKICRHWHLGNSKKTEGRRRDRDEDE